MAQSPPQPVVVDGLTLLVAGKCEDAVRKWTVAWTGDEAGKAQQLVASCALLEKLGTVHGYDLLGTRDVTPHLQRVYVVVRYEVEPVYMMFLAYAPDGAQWKIETLTWHTDPDKVIPPEILPPQHPGS